MAPQPTSSPTSFTFVAANIWSLLNATLQLTACEKTNFCRCCFGQFTELFLPSRPDFLDIFWCSCLKTVIGLKVLLFKKYSRKIQLSERPSGWIKVLRVPFSGTVLPCVTAYERLIEEQLNVLDLKTLCLSGGWSIRGWGRGDEDLLSLRQPSLSLSPVVRADNCKQTKPVSRKYTQRHT